MKRWIAALLATCTLFAACDSSKKSGGGGDDDEGGGATGCSAFCNAFADGCGQAAFDPCMEDCSTLSASCPAHADPLLDCLTGLTFECPSSGYAIAYSASGQSGLATLQGSNGTLEVQDPTCADLVATYQACPSSGPGGGGESAGGMCGNHVGQPLFVGAQGPGCGSSFDRGDSCEACLVSSCGSEVEACCSAEGCPALIDCATINCNPANDISCVQANCAAEIEGAGGVSGPGTSAALDFGSCSESCY